MTGDNIHVLHAQATSQIIDERSWFKAQLDLDARGVSLFAQVMTWGDQKHLIFHPFTHRYTVTLTSRDRFPEVLYTGNDQLEAIKAYNDCLPV